MKKNIFLTKILIASIFFFLPFISDAQDAGSLDLSFGTNGLATTFAGSANSVVFQNDGKIVVVGSSDSYDFLVTRYNSDGSLDTSFDLDGKVTTNLEVRNFATSVKIQNDGKIVAVGYSTNVWWDSQLVIIRYNTDGSLDTSFDIDGIVHTNVFGIKNIGNSIAIQNDGKIVVTGTSSEYTIDGEIYYALVVRYNTNGSLDTSFSVDGFVLASIAYSDTYGYSVAVQSDGKIVVVGENYNGFVVLRYNTDGSLDTSFDLDGIVITAVTGHNYGNGAYSVKIQSDGKIVVAGTCIDDINQYQDFALVRYNTDGSLDTTFDSDGKVIINMGNNYEYALSVAIQSDGKIVAIGSNWLNNPNSTITLLRYNSDGSLDNSFDLDGIVTIPSGNFDAYAGSVAIQSDGKIVVVGTKSSFESIVMRYNHICNTLPFSQSLTICEGENINVGSSIYTTSGTYTDNFLSVNGCAWIITTTLTVNPISTSSQSFTICEGENVNVGTSTYTVSGTYTDNFVAVNGCDSIVTTTLMVNPISTSSQSFTICEGENVNVGASTYTVSGTYTDNFITVNGCDSIVTTTLTVNPISTSSQSFTICEGENINVGTNSYTASGTYTDNFMTVNGCDSIVTTTLMVNPISTSSQSFTICGGENVNVGASTYAVSGTYTDNFITVNGCDSIVTTNLTVNPISLHFQSFTICEGENINVGTNSYTASGTYTDNFMTVNGCDSIVTTNLTVNPMPELSTSLSGFTISSNQNGASYQWIDCNNNTTILSETGQSFTATANGSYTLIVTLNGCLDTSTCVQISTIGIFELTKAMTSITIYPNPFSTSTTLLTDLFLHNASLTVYNVLGEQVEQISNINGQSITFSRNKLLNGLYFCELTQDNAILASGKLTVID